MAENKKPLDSKLFKDSLKLQSPVGSILSPVEKQPEKLRFPTGKPFPDIMEMLLHCGNLEEVGFTLCKDGGLNGSIISWVKESEDIRLLFRFNSSSPLLSKKHGAKQPLAILPFLAAKAGEEIFKSRQDTGDPFRRSPDLTFSLAELAEMGGYSTKNITNAKRDFMNAIYALSTFTIRIEAKNGRNKYIPNGGSIIEGPLFATRAVSSYGICTVTLSFYDVWEMMTERYLEVPKAVLTRLPSKARLAYIHFIVQTRINLNRSNSSSSKGFSFNVTVKKLIEKMGLNPNTQNLSRDVRSPIESALEDIEEAQREVQKESPEAPFLKLFFSTIDPDCTIAEFMAGSIGITVQGAGHLRGAARPKKQKGIEEGQQKRKPGRPRKDQAPTAASSPGKPEPEPVASSFTGSVPEAVDLIAVAAAAGKAACSKPATGGSEADGEAELPASVGGVPVITL